MKIAALHADHSGCGFYRVREPARAIIEKYPDIEIEVGTSLPVNAYRSRADGPTTVVEIQASVDLIIVQRPLHQHFTSMIEQAHRQDIAVVVELDDDFEHVHRKNSVWSNVQPENHEWSNYEWLKKACELADHVTVSTKALTRYAPHGRVTVVPNYISRHNISTHSLRRVDDHATRVGWSGTVATHPTDLQVTSPAVNQVLRDTNSKFTVIGDGVGVQDALGLAKSIPFRRTGWVETDRYFETLRGSMELGIVPLDLTLFNEAKSALKGLEFSACGIPFIASPTSEYLKLAALGVGEIARTPSEWRRLIKKYLENEELRLAAGEAYRSVIREKYVLENHTSEWTTAWEKAIDYRNRCTND
jgi:glycosyltransferase involved in cell wall biosynthesis